MLNFPEDIKWEFIFSYPITYLDSLYFTLQAPIICNFQDFDSSAFGSIIFESPSHYDWRNSIFISKTAVGIHSRKYGPKIFTPNKIVI